MSIKAVTIEILDIVHCPNSEPTRILIECIVKRLVPNADVKQLRVCSNEDAERLRFVGSPTIRVNGRDIQSVSVRDFGLTCRVYPNGTGVPPEWMVESAILRTLQPRHILFLCVANSARSQIAEGIARSLAPDGVQVSSAGSAPTHLRPEVVKVLSEIGIDASSQYSKGIDQIDSKSVEVVITLCAEEVCPVFPGSVLRLHWGLRDPAAIDDSEDERLSAFREIRDELLRRLKLLFD
jgi:arsenate reductase (thioredoxin)